MSQAALQLNPASATKWTVLSGPTKGSVRLITSSHFTVGRSTECEFVIVQDPKCSRKHASISAIQSGFEVVSLNEKNLVQLNGQPIERATLNDGDVITFGETEVRFNISTDADEVPLALVPPQTFSPAHAVPNQADLPRYNRPAPGTSPVANNKRFIVYGLVAILIIWLLMPSNAKKKAAQLRTEQQVSQSEIETANKLKEIADSQALKRGETNIPARQAQENFVRGFRDYRKGQFERSLMAFQSCLALDPEHVLCNRYLRLGKRKFDELVQYEIVLGRRYRDQNQYRACRSAFRNVMVMVKDPNSQTYQEAKANYEACDSLAEGKF